jgi:hypothetical protein
MYYKKLDDMPKLPKDLKESLLETAHRLFQEQSSEVRVLHHRTFETEDRSSLNFIGDDDLSFYEQSGGVTALRMPAELEAKVFECFKEFNHPIINLFDHFGFLLVEGGPYCAPHIDDVNRRQNGFQLLLASGGKQVTTAWWEPKDEFKDLTLKEYCGVPYSRLNKADEICMEDNCWHWMKFDSIHSVENLESIRIFLAGGTGGVGDYTDVIKDLYK